MADPATMAFTSMGLAAGGGILNAFGAGTKGRATADMYQFQAGVAQFNKKIAENNRDYAISQGEEDAVNEGLKSRFREGKVRADLGASGVDVNSGSADLVQKSQREIDQRDIALIRNRASRVAYGYATEAEKDELQSQLYTKSAENTRAATGIDVMSSLVSGASSVSSKWLQGKQAGAFT